MSTTPPHHFLLVMVSLVACSFWSVIPGGDTRAPTPTADCPASKIQFTQSEGCINDGSVEFCIPAGDRAALEQVRAIVPGIVCGRAGGRAKCDLDSELLCMLDTHDLCTGHHGAMDDTGWRTVCALAALPDVRAIVPTWYE